jgi:hypothetical protein
MISTKREGRQGMANQGSHEYLADKQPPAKSGGFGLRLRTGSIGHKLHSSSPNGIAVQALCRQINTRSTFPKYFKSALVRQGY